MNGLEGFSDVSALLGSGVYALVLRDEVVYVGKAKRLLMRLYSHKSLLERARSGKQMAATGPHSRAKAIPFSKVWIRPCPEDQMDRIEIALVANLCPRYNSHYIPTERRMSLANLGFKLVVMGVNLSVVKASAELERRA